MTTELASQDERRDAALRAASWGYPRPITAREVNTGRWFTNHTALIWFVSPITQDGAVPPGFEGVLSVHGIARPGRCVQALTRETERELCDIACRLGARKLYSLIPRETPNMPVKAMRRYLRRYGWLEDEFGSYKLFGG